MTMPLATHLIAGIKPAPTIDQKVRRVEAVVAIKLNKQVRRNAKPDLE
jgi:hypothetical protein